MGLPEGKILAIDIVSQNGLKTIRIPKKITLGATPWDKALASPIQRHRMI